MKSKLFLFGLVLSVMAAAATCTATDGGRSASENRTRSSPASQQASAPQSSQPGSPSQAAPEAAQGEAHAGHAHAAGSEVPAFETSPASLKRLPPTLSPDAFRGTQRIAYQMVREIPETIAQLPCYCHCDKGFGHKSLHSCFVDDHASHCSICVDEAVMAYNLQREGKFTPEQIRERIIAFYGAAD
jgi:hypothetical protein